MCGVRCAVVWCGVGWLEVVSVWGVWGVVGCGVPDPRPGPPCPGGLQAAGAFTRQPEGENAHM